MYENAVFKKEGMLGLYEKTKKDKKRRSAINLEFDKAVKKGEVIRLF